MDSKKLEEIVTCGVCFEFFNEDSRCPRMLSCGHTFCHSCLDKLLVQSPTCPTCKGQIQSQTTESIPVNFIAKNMISLTSQDNGPSEAQGCIPERLCSTSLNKLESEGFCMEHSNYKELRCMDCNSWICGICGVMLHKGCRTLLVKDSYKELKEQLLKSENGELCENLRRLQIAAKNSTDDNGISKANNELEKIKEKNFLSQCETLGVLNPFPSSLEDLRKLCEKQSVYAVEIGNKKILYGKVTVNGDKIWISSFQPEKPSGQLVPFKKLLLKFTVSTDLPNEVFLKLTTGGRMHSVVDLVIRSTVSEPCVRNFFLVCSALKGESYKGRILTCEDFGKYQLSSVKVSEAELIDDQVPSDYMGIEVVGGLGSESGFQIFTHGLFTSFYKGPILGVVVSGLDKLREMKPHSLEIIDCGFILNPVNLDSHLSRIEVLEYIQK